MKNKCFSFFYLLIFVFSVFPFIINAQIETVECYTSTGEPVSAGGTWYETYNGVQYKCTCRKSGGTDCVPVGSNSSNNGSNNSSGSFETQMVESIVAPLIENFFDWLFSPSTESSSSNNNNYSSTTYNYQPTEEELKEYKEQNEKWKEHVNKVKEEFSKVYNQKFTDQKKNTVDDFNNRIAKSEAIKTIKQLNCAAYQSLEAYELVKEDINNFKELETALENSQSLADFSSKNSSDCPPIRYEIPEVTVSNPIGFQQVLYQKIKLKADSLTLNTVQLKEKEKNIKQVVEEKKKLVEEIKLLPPEKKKDDKLMQDALDALKEALDEEKNVNEEILINDKSIEKLENIRSTYDLEKPKK